MCIRDREIKIQIGNAFVEEGKEQKYRQLEVKGRDFQTGLPRLLVLDEININEAIHKPLKQILEGVKEVLSQVPPELAADIVDKGIVLSGGSALLTNIERYFTYYLGVNTFVIEDPLFCVIRGLGMILENFNSFKDSIR